MVKSCGARDARNEIIVIFLARDPDSCVEANVSGMLYRGRVYSSNDQNNTVR